MECLSRIPYTSVLGFILVTIGCSIMTATLYDSLSRTEKLMSRYFFSINSVGYLLTVFISLSIALFVLCFFVLVFAFIATLATRNKLYHRNRCVLGGRRTAAFLMFLLYTFNLLWVGIMCVLTVPVVAWLSLSSICRNELANKKYQYNFSLNNYGIYAGSWKRNANDKVNVAITDAGAFKDFCYLVSTIGPLYTCSLAGALVVIIGLITSMGSLSSLYMRLKYTKQLTNFIVAFEDSKTNELDYIINNKAM